VGGNEAGMKLGADIRAADAALWRRDAVGPSAGKLRHVPPVLAVEVADLDDDEAALRGKAQWCLDHGVRVVCGSYCRRRARWSSLSHSAKLA
jgi:hypothetical protein